jgi:hypothetical protein
MKKCRQALGVISAIVMLAFPTSIARADIFGGDVAVLAQILVNAIEQLSALKSVVSTGSDELDLLQQINQGTHASMAKSNR